MKYARLVPLLFLLSGCYHLIAIEYPVELKYQKGKPPTGTRIALGIFTDTRLQDRKGKLEQKEIKIYIEETRRILGHFLTESGRFEDTVHLLHQFSGKKLADIINGARKSDCDYLLTGEVTEFDIQVVGQTWVVIPAFIFDMAILPLSGISFIATLGQSLVFMGGIFPISMVEAKISMVINLVDVRSGKTVKSFYREEMTRQPCNSLAMFGSFYDFSDDWQDLGRTMGRVSLNNLVVKLVDPIADTIIKLRKP